MRHRFGQVVVVHGQPAADVDEPILLRRIVMPSARETISRTMSATVARRSRLAGPDEPGVLGEAAGVQEQRDAERRRPPSRGCSAGDRLAAAGVVRDRHHDQRDVLRLLEDERSSAAGSMLPLKRCRADGRRPSVDREVDGLRPGELDVGAGRVEMGVVRDDLPGADDENRIFSAARPWWVGMMWRNGNRSVHRLGNR